MNKFILVALTTLTIVTNVNAENRFHQYRCTSASESTDIPTIVGTLGGIAIGAGAASSLGAGAATSSLVGVGIGASTGAGVAAYQAEPGSFEKLQNRLSNWWNNTPAKPTKTTDVNITSADDWEVDNSHLKSTFEKEGVVTTPAAKDYRFETHDKQSELVMRGHSKNPKMAEFIKNNRYSDSLVSHEQVISGPSKNPEMLAHIEKTKNSYPLASHEQVISGPSKNTEMQFFK